jgi:transposase-like protein
MEKKKFKELLKSVSLLNNYQDRMLREHMDAIAYEKRVSKQLETPYRELSCPHCGGVQLVRWGKRNDMQRYRCKICQRTFNSLTGTPLARLRRKGHWLDYADCLKAGLSVRKAAKECSVHPSTAFRWRHRFLQNSHDIKPRMLDGIVEASEVYFKRSEKGQRKVQLISTNAKHSGAADKVCVLISRDRNHNVYDVLLEKFTPHDLRKVLQSHLARDVLFCSDNNLIYRRFAVENEICHGFINLKQGEQVKKDIVHLRYVLAYQDKLKDWILGHFRGVATKYLPNYLSWMRELDEFDGNIFPSTFLLRAKGGGVYKDQPLTRTNFFH